MCSDSKDEQSKPFLDREAFQQLLEAAYVLQQHNVRLSQENPGLPSALREIHLMPGRRDLDLRSALALVAERLRKVSGATGVSICVVEEGSLRPLACAGESAHVPGGAVAANSLVATERLCSGRAFHSPNAEKDVRLDLAMCRQAGIGSLLVVGIPSEDGVAGMIELRSTSIDALAELEESCRWTAGIVGELLDRDTGRDPRFSLLAQADPRAEPGGRRVPQRKTFDGSECRVCGEPLREDESFCGNCSMPRSPAAGQENLQSKWASMWFMQRAQRTLSGRKPDVDTGVAAPVAPPTGTTASNIAAATRATAQPQASEGTKPAAANDANADAANEEEVWGPLRAAVEGGKFARFLRAALARLRQTLRDAGQRRVVARRLVVVSAAIALVLFLLQWNTLQSNSPSENSWFGSLLSEIGLNSQAESHDTRAYSGNPDVRVWVDTNAALYYCPGSSLYGKTPGGHFARQRAAQRDQIEPATRMPCW